MKKCDYILYDISNMLYRTFFANTSETDTTIAGLATHMGLVTLNKYFKQYAPRKKAVMVFDRTSWRKAYTQSDLCISGKPYKGNRRQDMSPSQQAKYQRFLGHLAEFEALVTKHSTIITLAAEPLEADDLIAGFVQQNQEDEIIIISSDSDLLQLMKHPNVRIISPATDKQQTLADYNDDPLYYLFQKCIRGDSTDNIQSAFPKVRSTRIQKAFTDPFERVQLMKETWKSIDGQVYTVEELFEENELLIDLEKQPDNIRTIMDNTIKDALSKERAYSHFQFMRYLGRYQLDKIAASIDQYIPLLSR